MIAPDVARDLAFDAAPEVHDQKVAEPDKGPVVLELPERFNFEDGTTRQIGHHAAKAIPGARGRHLEHRSRVEGLGDKIRRAFPIGLREHARHPGA